MASGSSAAIPNDLESYWLPFTPNRAFKAAPRLIARAKDMHYYTADGRALIDGAAGLWCTNAGHNRDPIVRAIQAQAAGLVVELVLHAGARGDLDGDVVRTIFECLSYFHVEISLGIFRAGGPP